MIETFFLFYPLYYVFLRILLLSRKKNPMKASVISLIQKVILKTENFIHSVNIVTVKKLDKSLKFCLIMNVIKFQIKQILSICHLQ
jgi:hypothetical protein